MSWAESKKKNFVREETITIYDKFGKPKKMKVDRVTSDQYGNPRYVVHFPSLDLSLDDYRKGKFKKGGFKKYSGSYYGGGLVQQSYNVEDDMQKGYDRIHGLKDRKRKYTVRERRSYFASRISDPSLTPSQRKYAKTQYNKLKNW